MFHLRAVAAATIRQPSYAPSTLTAKATNVAGAGVAGAEIEMTTGVVGGEDGVVVAAVVVVAVVAAVAAVVAPRGLMEAAR